MRPTTRLCRGAACCVPVRPAVYPEARFPSAHFPCAHKNNNARNRITDHGRCNVLTLANFYAGLPRNSIARFLPRNRPLKHHRPWPPQRIPRRMTMGMLHRMTIRMNPVSIVAHVAEMTIPVATGRSIRRRGLREPRRITDRAERNWRCADVVADGLQALQNGLPLFPVQLMQKRPQSLDERILEQRFPVGLRYEKPVQPHVQRL